MPSCIVPYADAGKPCSGPEDCEGRCLILLNGNDIPTPENGAPATGQCEPEHGTDGCYTVIVDGKAEKSICVC